MKNQRGEMGMPLSGLMDIVGFGDMGSGGFSNSGMTGFGDIPVGSFHEVSHGGGFIGDINIGG